jgi:hypothetical protein
VCPGSPRRSDSGRRNSGRSDIETVNGVDRLVQEKKLTKGDVLGHICFEGDYGNFALQGGAYAAKRLGPKSGTAEGCTSAG